LLGIVCIIIANSGVDSLAHFCDIMPDAQG
jgi:hypothetical protein